MTTSSMEVRLVTWAPCLTPSTSHLPTLDPDSLYAASVLQARRVSNYSLCPPSSFIHSRIPCLEEASTGVTLADDIDSIERFAGKHAGSSILDEDNNTIQQGDEERSSRRRWAKRKALEHYLLSTLHPLVYQTLFSQDLYSKHTAKVYHSGLSIINRASLINRLRTHLRHHYAIKGACLLGSGSNSDDGELGSILADNNARQYIQEEEKKERQSLANRGGISMNGKGKKITPMGGGGGSRSGGLLKEEKLAAARAFSEMRLRSLSEKVLQTVADALGSDEYFFASSRPSLLDLRLFSLLAPLLLPSSSYTTLAAAALPTLLQEQFSTLVAHCKRIKSLLWPIEIQDMLESSSSRGGQVSTKILVSTPGWPSLVGRENDGTERSEPSSPLTIRLASSLGRVCGQTYRYTSTMLSSSSSSSKKREPNASSTTSSTASSPPKTAMTEAARKEAQRVKVGRWIWIASAVVGMIGTAFASGLLAIEVVDENEEEEEMEEEQLVRAEIQENEEGALDDAATEVDDDDDDDDEPEFEIDIIDEDEDDDDDMETEEEFEFEEDE